MATPEAVQGAFAWAKKHPVIAGGVVVGVIAAAYIASRSLGKAGQGEPEGIVDPGILEGEGLEESEVPTLDPIGGVITPKEKKRRDKVGTVATRDLTLTGPIFNPLGPAPRTDVLLNVAPGVWLRPAGADRSPTTSTTRSRTGIDVGASLDYQARLLTPSTSPYLSRVVDALKDPTLPTRQSTPVREGTRVTITDEMRRLLTQRVYKPPSTFVRTH